jgi:prepilin-type N-terminal cleavage/methylation domain-containing protein
MTGRDDTLRRGRSPRATTRPMTTQPVTTSPVMTRQTAGFTLLEVLMASLIVSLVFIGATWAMSSTARTKAVYEERSLVALACAKELFELADTLPKQPSGAPGATTAAGILALDSLVGASFSPPLRADGSVDTELTGWSQDCNVTVHDLSELSVPTEASALDGLPPDGSAVYRLEVTVSEGDQPVEVAQWWISP